MLSVRSKIGFTLVALLFSLSVGCADERSVEGLDAQDGRIGVGTLRSDQWAKADTNCDALSSDYFEFLDDTQCRKRAPTNRDRALACPNNATHATVFSPVHGHEVSYQTADVRPVVDDTALTGIVPDDLRVTLVLVRRVDGRPHYRYLSNGRHDETFQPWSSTKFMAIANAGAQLRAQSNDQVGLTATVDDLPVGDLVSMVHNYDERIYTSNGLSRWFLNMGGRSALNNLIHDDWLDRPSWESLGGNYGHRAPDLGYSLVDESGSLEVEGRDEGGPRNHLSTYTIAEFLKRLVMQREDPDLALPGLTWPDVATLFYGAERSQIYRDGQPQGMQADTSIYVQQALDMDEIEARSHGQWRIFSKLGFGFARGGEFVNAAYGCFPVKDEQGEVVDDWGKEFFIVTQLNGRRRHQETDQRLAEIYRRLVGAVMDGILK